MFSPRLLFAALGVVTAATLAVQLSMNVERHGGLGAALYWMLRYFTFWTLALLAVVWLWAGAWETRRWSRSQSSAVAATTLLAAFVGVVYHLLLSDRHSPSGVRVYTNLMMHYAIPIAAAALWLAAAPKGRLTLRAPLIWLAFPLAYLAYALARGEATGRYPYFFIDASRDGYGPVLARMAALFAIFALGGAGMVALDRALDRRPKEAAS